MYLFKYQFRKYDSIFVLISPIRKYLKFIEVIIEISVQSNYQYNGAKSNLQNNHFINNFTNTKINLYSTLHFINYIKI